MNKCAINYSLMTIDLPMRHRFSPMISIITLRFTLRLPEEETITILRMLISMLGDSPTILQIITLICLRRIIQVFHEGSINPINLKPLILSPRCSLTVLRIPKSKMKGPLEPTAVKSRGLPLLQTKTSTPSEMMIDQTTGCIPAIISAG
jgi:hypothetical protein